MHLNVPLPRCISQGTAFVVTTAVDVINNPGGYDKRWQRRDETLRRADIAYAIRNTEDLYEILSHFEVAEGPMHTFGVLDRLDWKSCPPNEEPTMLDAELGDGTGGTDQYQLRKKYTRGGVDKYRTIQCPIPGSVLIAVNGVLVSTSDYDVNDETGIVTFEAGSIPATGTVVTAGFKFYVKCRFETNDLTSLYEGFRVGQMGNVMVKEVRE